MFITGNNLAILYALFESFPSQLPGAVPAISQTAGALMITAIWQGAIVAACLAVGMRFASRVSAGMRFALWTGGFLVAAGLPFLPMVLHIFSGPALQSANSLATAPRFSLDYRWSIVICLAWTAASLYRALDLAAHTFRLRKLWLSAEPVHTESAPAKLRGRRAIEICTTDALDRPSVIGFLAPRILIPTWLLSRLTAGELNQIVLHETEHLRRGDDWTNLLQKLSLILFPLNPVLLWMERQLCLEREMACDEAVIRVTRAPRAYAACLTTLAERGIEFRAQAGETLSLGAWRRRPELVHRVHTLLNLKPMLGPWGNRGLAAVLSCGLVFGSVELARCPQLVAFVPAHPATEAHLSKSGPQTGLSQPHEMLAAWKPSERSIRPRMIETRANLTPHSNPIDLSPESTPSSARKLASQASPRLYPPHQVPLKADAAGAQQTPEQSWLVMTTWEEVAVDSTANAPAPVATENALHEPNRVPPAPERQIRVTRMVFRVVPASFVSPSPTAVQTSDGWLVIQM